MRGGGIERGSGGGGGSRHEVEVGLGGWDVLAWWRRVTDRGC